MVKPLKISKTDTISFMRKELDLTRERALHWEKLCQYWELRWMALEHETTARSYRASADALFPETKVPPSYNWVAERITESHKKNMK